MGAVLCEKTARESTDPADHGGRREGNTEE